MEKKLTKSTDRRIKGVCAGIAEYIGLDATLVRVLYAIFTIAGHIFWGIVIYFILAFVLPEPAEKKMIENK